MADIKVQDQVVISADRLSMYNLVDGSLEATVNQLTNVTMSQTQDTQWYVGKQQVRLAGIDTNKQFEVTASNGFIDLATMSLQTGDDVTVYDSVTNFLATPILDEIEVIHGDTNDTAITEFTAISPSKLDGDEIEYIYLINGSSIAGARKFKQGTAASTTSEVDAATDDTEIFFAYDPATKTITLPEGLFTSSSVVLAQYQYAGVGLETSSDTEHFSKTVKAVLDVTLQDLCNKNFNHGQFIVPRAKVDGKKLPFIAKAA